MRLLLARSVGHHPSFLLSPLSLQAARCHQGGRLPAKCLQPSLARRGPRVSILPRSLANLARYTHHLTHHLCRSAKPLSRRLGLHLSGLQHQLDQSPHLGLHRLHQSSVKFHLLIHTLRLRPLRLRGSHPSRVSIPVSFRRRKRRRCQQFLQ